MEPIIIKKTHRFLGTRQTKIRSKKWRVRRNQPHDNPTVLLSKTDSTSLWTIGSRNRSRENKKWPSKNGNFLFTLKEAVALWDQGWRGTGPKMARIRKIPDTWTLEIHAIVLKDSHQSRTRGNWLHKHDKTKVSVLEHETWWERSSKRKERRETTRHDKAKLRVLKHQTWWERSSKRKERRETTRHDKTKLSVLKHQTWWERSSKQKERLETTRHDKTKLSVLEHQRWWERSLRKARHLEERKIKRLNHHGQTASTYGSLLRPEWNWFPDRRMTTIFFW